MTCRWPALIRIRLASLSGRSRSPWTILPDAWSSSAKRLWPCTTAAISACGAWDRFTMACDFGLSPHALNHNFRELAIDPSAIDALGLSHGHRDHWGGLTGFLHAWRRRLRRDLPFYGGVDHFEPRWQQRGERRVYSGRLSRDEIERYDVPVTLVAKPTTLAEGVWLSGEMHGAEDWETIPSNLRVERAGAMLQDTFIGEQTLVANVRDRGLVVITSCSHRGIVGICRNAVRITGVSRVHAVMG